MGNSGIFSLDKVYKKQVAGTWTDTYDPFVYVHSYTPQPGVPGGPAYGYSGGGGAGSFGSRETGGTRVERIDFANDTATASLRGSLAHDHLDCAAFGNTTHGYVMGDSFTTTNRSWISRVTYASDTSTASPRGNMSVPRGGNSSTGNASYAWISGQYDWMPSSAGQYASRVDRIDFSNDNTTTSARGNLDRAVAHIGASGNASYGWWAGGATAWNQPDHTSVSRIDYASDSSTASPKGTLSDPVESNTATGNINYGYNIVGGPVGPSTPSLSSAIVRYDYASDTGASTPKGSLSVVRYDLAGATGSQSYGYFMGGYNPNTSPSYFTTVDRIDYSNDTATASPKGNLDQNAAGPSPGGYRKAGGFSGQENAFGSAPPATIVPATQTENGKLTDKGSDGYFITVPGGSGVPSPSYVYMIGGEGQPGPTPYANPAQRIDVTNDTAIAVAKAGAAPPTNRLYYCCSTGNRDYAWTTMGATRSNVQRMDYANDSAQMVNRNNRPNSPQLGYNETAVGNENYGYFNGGYILYTIPGCGSPQGATNLSHIIRMDYANDTNNPVLKSYNTNRAGMGGACGNLNYGYWMGAANGICGGYSGSSTFVERTDYSNDTTNSSPKGPLNQAVYANRGQGNNDYGYSVGGQSRSRVQRITYSNDTATTSPRGNLAENMGNHQTAGTQTLGYSAGGNGGSTVVNRIQYSNDTATASPKGPLVYRSQYGGGASASENGMQAIPAPPPTTTYTPRIRWVDQTIGLTPPVQRPFSFPVQLPAPGP